jgi:hypothetical protein
MNKFYIFLSIFLISFFTQAQSDFCATATPLASCTVQSGTNAGSTSNSATDDSYPPGDICAFSIENTVWYTYTATTNGLHNITTTLGTCTSGFGLQVGVLTGNCGGPYTSLDCSAINPNATAVLNATLTVGQQVFLVMDGNGGDECTIAAVDICPDTCNFYTSNCL